MSAPSAHDPRDPTWSEVTGRAQAVVPEAPARLRLLAGAPSRPRARRAVSMPDRRDRALLLDLDGVLRRWPADLATRAERAAGLPLGSIHAAAFDPELLRRAITGAIDDATWRSEAALRIARDHPHGPATQALIAWSAPVGEVDPEVRSLVAQARHRARVILVTNATTRLDDDLRALGLTDALDEVVNSSVVGHAKPDEHIFRAALERTGVPGACALFVDDAAANVAAAQALGIAGHLFRDPAGLAGALALHGFMPGG